MVLNILLDGGIYVVSRIRLTATLALEKLRLQDLGLDKMAHYQSPVPSQPGRAQLVQGSLNA